MSIIRDNRAIILGITGYLGSGCTTVAKYLAFEFSSRIKDEFKKDRFSLIENFYQQLEELQKNPLNNEDKMEEIKSKLKKELEKREILQVIRRNRFELKKSFYYISFSNIIVYFLIKFIQKTNDEVRRLIEEQLNNIGFKLEEAITLVRDFYYITKKRRFLRNEDFKSQNIDFQKLQEIKRLFENFYIIRDKIVERFGRELLQNYGDNIRKSGNPYISSLEWRRSDYKKARFLAWIVDKYIYLLTMLGEQYFVVECFKNAQELFYFREKYSYFYLIALSVNKELRKQRAKVSNYDEIEKREEGSESDIKEFYKLNVLRCIDLADVVLKNEDSLSRLFWKLLRIFALILEPGCIKPTVEETLMHLAYTLSVRSNCICRQVGAIITNEDGYIIGAGWNDVGEGQISCGLKTVYDYKNISYLQSNCLDLKGFQDDDYICFRQCFRDNNGGLIHCLALHAEENAILQSARYQSNIPKGSTIYTTTFPCPLCLKKIAQVGIRKIVYTETYSNPILSKILEENIKYIEIRRFEGVKYYSYFRLFKPYYDRKDQQNILKRLREV